MHKLIRMVAVAAMVALGGTAAESKAFRYAASAPLLTMDPHATNDFVTQMVVTQIYEALVRLDVELKLTPGLALSWEPNGERTWRFRLRPGVRFHDGTELTPADIVFSVARARAGRFWSVFAGPIEKIDVVDATTLDITTKAPDPLLPRKMSKILIMSEAWSKRHGAEKAHDLAATGGEFHAQRNANGTGPFLLREHGTARTVLARHAGWWGRNDGNVTEAVFTQIAAAPTRVAALLSGEIDLVTDLPLQDIDRVRAAQSMKVVQAPQLMIVQLEMDGTRDEANAMWDRQGNPLPRNPFKDVRVRRAVAHAIDANLIVQRVMRGQGVPAGIAAIPGVNGYQKDLDRRWAFDPARSKALLAEAGYPQGFKVQLNCPSDRYVNSEAICRAVAAQLAQVQVEVQLNLQPWAAFVPPLTRLESSFHFIGSGPTGQDTQDTLHGTMMTRTAENGFFNWARWSNPEFDAAVTRLLREFDPARRDALYREALRIARDDVHAVYLHAQMVTWGARATVDARIRQDAQVMLDLVKLE